MCIQYIIISEKITISMLVNPTQLTVDSSVYPECQWPEDRDGKDKGEDGPRSL